MADKELKIQPEKSIDTSPMTAGSRAQFKAAGSSGTDLFAGYFTEEYLQKLRGRYGAKIYDEIRRSEAQVAMLLNAIMNPIKAGMWEFEAADIDEVPDAEKHKELIEHMAKQEIDFETFLHEALTMIIFGYSLMERVDSVVFDHPKFGTYCGLKGLAFRSQKTIERWIVSPDTGNLQTVEQYVFGDTMPKGGTKLIMDAQFLLVFTLQKEGDNFEGISALRPMYGPWFRKNLYLKVAAIGIEKNAIGTPIGTVPATVKQGTDEFKAFQRTLENFAAHESAYLITPEGWKIEVVQSEFKAGDVKEMILLENSEMINSVVANFLALGMNGGSGSFALGTDLSDFFLNGLQIYANIICGVWNRNLIPDKIKQNFGPQQAYPKLKATGINDKAGKELAEIVVALLGQKALKADDKLEEYLRKQYALPKADPTTARESAPPQIPGQPSPLDKDKDSEVEDMNLETELPIELSERRAVLAETYKKKWANAKDEVKEVMQTGLKEVVAKYEKEIRKAWANMTVSQRRNVALNLQPKGMTDYINSLREVLAKVANASLIDAQKETPKARKKNIKLSESMQFAAPKGGYYEALPNKIKNIIKNQAGLIAQTQALDINKVVQFQFLSSADATEDVDQVLADINSIVVPAIEGSTGSGMSIDAAAGNAVSTAVNQARLEWFFEPEVLETIESFTFVNEDPVSEICQELDGTTWAVGDPDIDRYTPPLHHNCKSRLEVNEKGAEGNPAINRGGTAVSEKALKSMTLHDCTCDYHIMGEVDLT